MRERYCKTGHVPANLQWVLYSLFVGLANQLLLELPHCHSFGYYGVHERLAELGNGGMENSEWDLIQLTEGKKLIMRM